MEVIKHETCPQYVDRRLSEGWSIVWQQGYHLILSSPDGNILRPVDLRNDVETLRPNAAGDLTALTQFPATGSNYDKVNEESPDELTTYLYEDTGLWKRDLYNLPAHSGSGTINKVTVFLYCKAGLDAVGYDIEELLKTHGVGPYNNYHMQISTSWTLYSHEWTNNPYTTNPWTWDEIDALQIGVGAEGGANKTYCTQVYVEVNYIAVAAKPTFRLDPRPHKRMRSYPSLKLGG